MCSSSETKQSLNYEIKNESTQDKSGSGVRTLPTLVRNRLYSAEEMELFELMGIVYPGDKTALHVTIAA